jgi:hypothetical protein
MQKACAPSPGNALRAEWQLGVTGRAAAILPGLANFGDKPPRDPAQRPDSGAAVNSALHTKPLLPADSHGKRRPALERYGE